MKKINKLMLMLAVIFLGSINTKALTITQTPSSYLSVQNSGSYENDDLSNINELSTCNGVVWPCGAKKTSNEGNLICLSGYDISAPIKDSVCSASDWTDKKTKYAIGYIINLINATNLGDNAKLYWEEVLVNGYFGYLDSHASTSRIKRLMSADGDKKIPGANKKYADIITEANNYANNVKTSVSITANNSASLNLSFTEGTDGYYHSQEVTINSDLDYTLGAPNNNKFTYDKNGNKYVFKIKSSDVSLGSSQSFTSTTSISSNYVYSNRYDCPSGYQDVTLATPSSGTASDSVTISGTVTKEYAKLIVKKVDNKNKLLAGVEFMLQTQEQYNSKTDGVKKTTTASNNLEFDNLNAGIYYLTETKPLDGYNYDKTPIKIVIDSSGDASVEGKKIDNNTLKISNTLTETVISKKSAVNGEELPGATLEILDENKEKMSCTIIDKDGNNKELEECSWISTDEPTKVIGLPAGKYFLRETIAPEGYELSTSMVEFEVLADGNVTEVEMIDELEVEVPNTLSARSALLLTIAMIDIALGIGIITYVKKNKLEQ